jgi:hypothetical protein
MVARPEVGLRRTNLWLGPRPAREVVSISYDLLFVCGFPDVQITTYWLLWVSIMAFMEVAFTLNVYRATCKGRALACPEGDT